MLTATISSINFYRVVLNWILHYFSQWSRLHMEMMLFNLSLVCHTSRWSIFNYRNTSETSKIVKLLSLYLLLNTSSTCNPIYDPRSILNVIIVDEIFFFFRIEFLREQSENYCIRTELVITWQVLASIVFDTSCDWYFIYCIIMTSNLVFYNSLTSFIFIWLKVLTSAKGPTSFKF